MKIKAIIVDVDGTIAHNDGHRDPFEWSLVKFDEPILGVINFIKVIPDEIQVLYVSGRMDICYDDTFAWIEQHVGKSGPLYMRKTEDYRSDVIVKREIYYGQIEPFYDVIGVFDDRNKVVAMWREVGLTCFQVIDSEKGAF